MPDIPTLRAFAPRFLDGHSRGQPAEAERDRGQGDDPPRAPAARVGSPTTRHDQDEDVRCLKSNLQATSPKTANNVLAVLSVLLKKAVEWEIIERMPCSVKLLPVPKGSSAFYDFDEYERLVEAARVLDPRTLLIVLLGGEAGLRCGETIALE